MTKFTKIKSLLVFLLMMALFSHSSLLYAQKRVASGKQSAGFSFATDKTATQPVIHYQQNIHMLAGIDDRPTVSVFGSGRVLVHYPAYMKKAGDYEMQLDDAELTGLVQNLSNNGVTEFDEKKVKRELRDYKKSLQSKGELYAISDAVETSLEIQLDDYQKNKSSAKIKNFKKQFKWKNLEQDAARFKSNSEIIKANSSISQLKQLMKDQRLVKRDQR